MGGPRDARRSICSWPNNESREAPRMKILHVVSMYYPAVAYGGPAHGTRSQSLGLSDRGHKVTVLTTDLESIAPLRRLREAGKDDSLDIVRLPGVAARGARAAALVGLSPFSFIDSPLADEWMG